MLKAKKYTFGVTECHFLEFLISPEGIKPQRKKVEVVLSMSFPLTTKEVQRLNGRMAALARFLTLDLSYRPEESGQPNS